MNNSNLNTQNNTQDQPPNYSQAVRDSSQTGYGNYPQSYSQNPAAYPPQQGYAAGGPYPSQSYPQCGGYTNYPQPQYYPPPVVTNNNQTVIIKTNAKAVPVEVPVESLTNYKCLAIFAIIMFLPTGIVALIKSNDAQCQYLKGNIGKAFQRNLEARKWIRTSLIIGLMLIIALIVLRVKQIERDEDLSDNTYPQNNFTQGI